MQFSQTTIHYPKISILYASQVHTVFMIFHFPSVTETPNYPLISVLPSFSYSTTNNRLNNNRIKSYISQSLLRLHTTMRQLCSMGCKQKWCAPLLTSILTGKACDFLPFLPSFCPEQGQTDWHLGHHLGSEGGNCVLRLAEQRDRKHWFSMRWGHHTSPGLPVFM